MGKREPQGNRGIIPLDWVKAKLTKKEKKTDKIVQ